MTAASYGMLAMLESQIIFRQCVLDAAALKGLIVLPSQDFLFLPIGSFAAKRQASPFFSVKRLCGAEWNSRSKIFCYGFRLSNETRSC